MTMIGHLSFGVRDLPRAKAFYTAVLAPLGYVELWGTDSGVGFGQPGKGDGFALFFRPGTTPPGPGFHLAFNAPDRAGVDEFYSAAISLGASDSGPPGIRSHYSPTYYAAFVIDPEGYKIEAVHQ